MWAFIYLYVVIFRQKVRDECFALVDDLNRQQKREDGSELVK